MLRNVRVVFMHDHLSKLVCSECHVSVSSFHAVPASRTELLQ